MCLIDCKIDEIWDKQLAIHWWLLLFETFEDYAMAKYWDNEDEMLKFMQDSNEYYEQASYRLKNIPPLTSILSFKISEQIWQIINLLAIK